MHRHFLQKIAYVSVLGGFAAVLGSGSALAEGFKMGKFLVQPKIEVREFYNDNLYTKQTGEESDFITHVKPSVTLNSQFDKNALNAGASLNGGKYLSDDENDFVDGNVYINGRYDGPQNLKALIGAGYTRGHEDRGSSSNLSGEEPLVFDVRTVSAGLIKRAAKVSARVDLKYDIYGYNNVSRKGLSDTDNGDRDRAEFYPSVRLGYTLTPNYELFFRGSYNTWNYDDTLDRNSKKKDGTLQSLQQATFDFSGMQIKILGEKEEYVNDELAQFLKIAVEGNYTMNMQGSTREIIATQTIILEKESGAWKITETLNPWG